MQTCICWLKGMNTQVTVLVLRSEAVAFDEASDIGFVHCHEQYPLLLGYHNFAVFFPGEPHQPNGYAGMEDKVRKYLF